MPVWASILGMALALAGGTTGTVAVTKILERGREPALIAKLTTAAAKSMHDEYEQLIRQHREDAGLARALAADAQLRATEAEVRAQSAELRAARLEVQLAELLLLVRRYVPESEHRLSEYSRFFSPGSPSGGGTNGRVIDAPSNHPEEEKGARS